ncbi:hypothetical protein N431DRAFT_485237 [Stipitochalara longipes BDJ]|nr:hypothetical protein N431DRAFT_485237 [Stipitochalara longipes BDJ]
MAHRYNPFTGKDSGARGDPTSSQTSQNRMNDQGRRHPEEQDIATYQSYGGFKKNSAYGEGDYVPPTPGSLNPFSYDAPVLKSGVDQDAEYDHGYGSKRPSFLASPGPSYPRTPSGRRGSRFVEHDIDDTTSTNRRDALSTLTGGAPEPNRPQPSPWRAHRRQEGDIEMRDLQDFQNVDLEAGPQDRNTNVVRTKNFWSSTANIAPERSCWQGFRAHLRGDLIGLGIVFLVIMALVGFFIAIGFYYSYPSNHPADE